MDKRTTQLRRAKYKADERKDDSYTLVKLMVESEGVVLPNARNGGEDFDKWLADKLAAMKAK